jgi:hypothetical protein
MGVTIASVSPQKIRAYFDQANSGQHFVLFPAYGFDGGFALKPAPAATVEQLLFVAGDTTWCCSGIRT